jgi:hypothetical protein
MPLSKLILGFLIRFIVIYGLLIYPWPGWRELYGEGFRDVGNAIYDREGEKRIVHFEAHEETKGFAAIDTRIVLGNRDLVNEDGTHPTSLLGFDSRSICWLPTALTMTFILATPIPWRRRAWALLWGMVLIHLFLWFSVACYIWNESTGVSLITLSPFWKQISSGLEYILILQMGASFSVPLVIWILVTFREEDRKYLFQKVEQ